MGAPVTTTDVAVDFWEADFARNLNPRDVFCFDDAHGLPAIDLVIVAGAVTVTDGAVRIEAPGGRPGVWWLPRDQRVNIGRRNELAAVSA